MNIIQNFRNPIDIIAPKAWETIKENSVVVSTLIFAAVMTEIHGKEEFSAKDMTKLALSSVLVVSSAVIRVFKPNPENLAVRLDTFSSEECIEAEEVVKEEEELEVEKEEVVGAKEESLEKLIKEEYFR